MFADKQQDEVERIKRLISGLVTKVPPSVNAGGVQLAREFKKVVDEANKMLKSNRTTLLKAQAVFGKLNAFYA